MGTTFSATGKSGSDGSSYAKTMANLKAKVQEKAKDENNIMDLDFSSFTKDEPDDFTRPWIQACFADDESAADLMIEKKQFKTSEDSTPIHLCAMSPLIVQKLLRYFDVNTELPGTKSTPLHFAVYSNKPEAVRFLLLNGANPIARDSDDSTPYQLAREANLYASMSVLRPYMIRYYNGDPSFTSWRQVCRPEFLALNLYPKATDFTDKTTMKLFDKLHECVSYNFCLNEQVVLNKVCSKSGDTPECMQATDTYVACLKGLGMDLQEIPKETQKRLALAEAGKLDPDAVYESAYDDDDEEEEDEGDRRSTLDYEDDDEDDDDDDEADEEEEEEELFDDDEDEEDDDDGEMYD